MQKLTLCHLCPPQRFAGYSPVNTIYWLTVTCFAHSPISFLPNSKSHPYLSPRKYIINAIANSMVGPVSTASLLISSSHMNQTCRHTQSLMACPDGLSWHLCALKTRKHIAFKLFEAIDLKLCQLWPCGCQLVCWACRWIHEYWQKCGCCFKKCGCCFKKWSGWNPTNPTGDYSP